MIKKFLGLYFDYDYIKINMTFKNIFKFKCKNKLVLKKKF